MGIDKIKPRQFAPSVGTGGADCAIVMVPTKAIYNSSATESHLLFGDFDFTAHSPATLKDFTVCSGASASRWNRPTLSVSQSGCPCH